ncbi:MAG: DNA polymerase I, partial [Clostridiales bacterium]
YGSLDALYENINGIKQEKLRQKLIDYRDQAFLCRDLATIDKQVPLSVNWQLNEYHADHDPSQLRAVYDKLELKQLLRGLGKAAPLATPASMPFTDEDAPWPEGGMAAMPAVAHYANAEQVIKAAETVGCCRVVGLWQGSPVQGRITALAIAAGEQLLCAAAEDEVLALLPKLKPLLENEKICKITVNSKELQLLLATKGIIPAGIGEDVMIAAYLLNPAVGSYDIGALAVENDIVMPDLPEPAATAVVLADLATALESKLQQNGMEKLYHGMELPLCTVLADMEQAGIRVEEQKLIEMSAALAHSAEGYQEQIYGLAGHAFNLNSPKQLGVVLFEEMGIAPLKKNKTGYSTDAEVLEQLALTQPIAALFLEYRLVAKLKSTYTDGLRALIDPQTGKLHTSFKQTVTATGRLSSVEPNLQNIPVRHELGRRIREVFVADQPGDLLLAADYNQIELRVLAHIAADPKLTEAFIRGEDIHTRTAALIFDCAAESVTPEQRRNAKTINFGLIYGMGAQKLAQELKISTVQAKEFIGQYFEHMAQLKLFYEQVEASARELGLVTTLAGRRRLLPDMQSQKPQAFALARRQAINTVIQGSAADIIKIAMLAVQHDSSLQTLQANLVLQVHDELLLEVPAAHGTAAGQRVSTLMAGVLPAGTA